MTRTTRSLTLAIAGLAMTALAAAGYVAARRGVPVRLGAAPDSVVLADSAKAKCRGMSSDAQMDCYDTVLVPLVKAHGVRTAMATLDQIASSETQIKVDGHVYAHAIGIAAGRAGGDMGQTFASCNEIFQSGCYHGVIQAYFESVH